MTEILFLKKSFSEIKNFTGIERELTKRLIKNFVIAHRMPKEARNSYLQANKIDTVDRLRELSLSDPVLEDAVMQIFYAEINDLEWLD